MTSLLDNEPKTADYFITFYGHVVEDKRPENFPKIVKSTFIVRVLSLDELKKVADQEAIRIVKQGGMVISLGEEIEDPDGPSISGNRIFIPMHMFAYISSEYKKLAADFPTGQPEASVTNSTSESEKENETPKKKRYDPSIN